MLVKLLLYIVASIIVLAPAVAMAQAPDRLEAPYSPAPESDALPEFQSLIDWITVSIDLPALRRVNLPENHRELRIWFGFGIPGVSGLLRILDAGSEVRGELFRWTFPEGPSSLPSKEGDGTDSTRSHRHCGESVAVSGHIDGFCRLDVPPTADWRMVLDSLATYRVWQLPQGPERLILEGQHLVVEIREQQQYRTYYYSSPDLGTESTDRRASAILDFVSSGLRWKFWQERHNDEYVFSHAGAVGCAARPSVLRGYVTRLLTTPRSDIAEWREVVGLASPDIGRLEPVTDGSVCRSLQDYLSTAGPGDLLGFFRIANRYIVVLSPDYFVPHQSHNFTYVFDEQLRSMNRVLVF